MLCMYMWILYVYYMYMTPSQMYPTCRFSDYTLRQAGAFGIVPSQAGRFGDKFLPPSN